MEKLCELSAARIVEAVAAGELSATEVARAALSAIEEQEPQVQAFLQVTPELALAAAERVDAARAAKQPLGALAGVPVAIKDNMNLLGTRTTCASRMLETYESAFTATCVERLLAAGAVPVGKTNMDEFAFGSTTDSSAFHPTNNPWNTACVPGGSSGGSAAAVAAFEVPLALGSDTGGSVRQPASLCGVVGLKPSYGAVSRYGVVAFGSSLDQVGPLTRTVEDAALALEVLTADGRDPRDSTSCDAAGAYVAATKRGAEGLTVGLIPAFLNDEALDTQVRAAVLSAADTLRDAGARVVEVELSHVRDAIAAYYVLGPCEAFSNLARFDGVRFGYQAPGCDTLAQQTSLSRAHGFGAEVKRRMLLGAYLLSSEAYERYYLAAQKARTLITRSYAHAFEQVDVLLMPTSPTVAWRHGEISDPARVWLSDVYTVASNIAGTCAISVPVGLSHEGLPIGAQLQGPALGDATLLAAAAALERAIRPL